MTHCVILLAMLAQALPVSPTGRPTPNAVNVQVDPAHPLPITGTISASSSVRSTTAAPTYVNGTDNPFSSDLAGSLRIICMGGTCGGASPFSDNAAFTAGATSVNVVAGVFNDSITALTSGRAGAPRLTSFRAMHLNLRDNSGNEIPFPAALAASGGFKVDVQNTSIAVTGTFWQATQPVSGTFWQATQPVSGTFWQATQPVSGTVTVSNSFALDATLTGGTQKAIVRGGAKGATAAADVTSTANGADHQGLDVAVQGTVPVSGPLTDAQLRASVVPTSDAHTTAAAPLSSRLSDGAAFYDATKTGQLPAALDGSGFLKTHEQGTAAISAASLPLPTGAATEATLALIKTDVDKIPASPSTDRTTAAAPFSVRISDGAAFIDPRDISDRVGRALGVVSVTGSVAVTGTFWQATQPVSGTLTVTQGTGTNLHMVCDSGCTPGGSFADGSAFAAGSTAINVSGGVYDDTLGAITTGNAGSPRITAKRAFHVNLRDASGNEITSFGSSTGKVTDGEYGINQAKVLGPAQAPQAKDSALVVAISPNTPVNVVNLGGTNNLLVKTTPLLQGPVTRTQIVDPSGRPATVLGPRQTPNGSENAQVFIQSPIPVPTCPLNAALSQTTSTTVIAGSAGKTTYICKVFVVSTTAQSISLTEGTGTTCGTGGAALAGHTTVANGMALAANGGWVEGNGVGIVYTARKLGDDICVLQSGAGNLAGSISYVQF